jgi:hypothetical protein
MKLNKNSAPGHSAPEHSLKQAQQLSKCRSYLELFFFLLIKTTTTKQQLHVPTFVTALSTS